MTDGFTPSSARTLNPRSLRESFDTALRGSFKSPKTMALAGQAAAHAGTISPSRTLRPSPFAVWRAF